MCAEPEAHSMVLFRVFLANGIYASFRATGTGPHLIAASLLYRARTRWFVGGRQPANDIMRIGGLAVRLPTSTRKTGMQLSINSELNFRIKERLRAITMPSSRSSPPTRRMCGSLFTSLACGGAGFRKVRLKRILSRNSAASAGDGAIVTSTGGSCSPRTSRGVSRKCRDLKARSVQ